MKKNVILLTEPDSRPAGESWVWFKDGWKLLQAAPLLWLSASLAAIGIYFLVAIASAAAGVLFPFLDILPALAGGLAIKMGMVRLCQDIADGELPKGKAFFDFWQQRSRPAVWKLLLLLLAANAVIAALQHNMLPEKLLVFDEQDGWKIQWELFTPYTLFFSAAQLVTLLLSWAMPVLFMEFSNASLAQLLRLQWQGMLKNWLPLLLLGLLNVAAVFFYLMFIAVLVLLLPHAALVLILAGAVLLWPLSAAWTFSAVRHIFTDW